MAAIQKRLIEASKAGDAAAARELLEAGASPNLRTSNGRFDDPPLACAVEANSLECVQLLLDAGAEINIPLGYLCVAARASSVEMLRTLLDAGADPTWHDELTSLCQVLASTIEPVAVAASMVRELHVRGVDIDHGHPFPYLWSAAQSGQANTVEALLLGGANSQVQPNPLGGAVWGTGSGDQETARVIDLLVAAGCNLNDRDDQGLGLMHGALMPYSHGSGFASSDGINLAAVRALRRHGVSIDIMFPGGRRPLHVAAHEADPEAVAELLAAGASADDRTPEGRTARDVALARKSEFEGWAEQRRSADPETDDGRFREALTSSMIPAADRCIAILQGEQGDPPTR